MIEEYLESDKCTVKINNSKSIKSNDSNRYDKSLLDEKKICSQNKKFAILRRTNCQACGLFSYYIVHIGCIINFYIIYFILSICF